MRARIAVVVVVIGLAVLKTLVSSLESRLVFFPYSGEDRTPASLGIPYTHLQITTADGERLAAWQLEPKVPVADVVYFHGNGGNLSVWLPVFAALHRLDLRVLAVDYRGYGVSSGAPSERGVYLDAEAAVRYAEEHRPRGARPLVFWGRSLGGPIAASATRVVTPDGLILESTFADKAAVVRRSPVLRALNVFAAYRFDTVGLLEGFSKPTLVVHGDRDSIIPYALGKNLFDRLSGTKHFLAVPGHDHNDFVEPENHAYWTPVLGFINGLRQGPVY